MNKLRLSTLVCCLVLASAPGTARELTVVQVAPLSGPLAATGRDLMLGARACLEEVNRQGGAGGHTLRLLTRDDGYRADETVRQAREALSREQPIAFLGFVGTGNLQALQQDGLLAAAGIPLVGVRTGARSLRVPGSPLVFHLRASYDDETAQMIDTATTMGLQRFAVFYQNDPFGREGLAGVEAALARHGLQPVALAGYEKNSTEVGAAAATLARVDPQGVIMISNTLASAAFVRTMRAAGYAGQLMGVSVNDAAQIVDRIGVTAARGLVLAQVLPSPGRREIPLVRGAARALAAAGETRLSYTMLEGCLYARTLAEGVRRAGRAPDRAALVAALETLRGWDAGGISVDFSGGRREGSRFVDLSIVGRDGQLLH